MKNIARIMAGVCAFILWSQYVYYSTDSIVVGWNSVAGATAYNVRAAWVGDVIKREYDLGKTTSTSMMFRRPRTGMFQVWVNAENGSGVSAWSRSNDSARATVNNVARGWLVYFDVPPVTGGEIE